LSKDEKVFFKILKKKKKKMDHTTAIQKAKIQTINPGPGQKLMKRDV
jgi:hypothetical protein